MTKHHLLRLTVCAVFAFAGGLISTKVFPPPEHVVAAESIPSVVKAGRFEVVDGNGRTVGVLGLSEEGPFGKLVLNYSPRLLKFPIFLLDLPPTKLRVFS